MSIFRFWSFAIRWLKLSGLSLVFLSIGACDTPRPPPQSTDPGTIARRVVADFLSLPMAEVTLVSLNAQEFNNSSLGCPASGMSYQQVITPGHRAIVEAQGRRFDIRVAGAHGKMCRNSKGGGPKRNSGRESALTSMVERARHNLAELLKVEAPLILMVDMRPYHGSNPPTGCTPQCIASDAQCGYIIGLFYDGRRYDYHVTNGNAVPCPKILRM